LQIVQRSPAVGFIGNFSENPDAFFDLPDLFFLGCAAVG
jgi:hypothetical protein